MSLLNNVEPLGLPNASVRAIIALVFTATTAFLFATGQAVPTELLVVNSLVDGFYFGTRTATPPAPIIEPLDAPFVPG